MDERTDEEIVEQTNDLAIEFASALGYRYAAGHPVYLSKHPRARQMWRLACIAQERLTSTDPDDALSAIDVDLDFPDLPAFIGESI